jgi:UDP-hydrolysing UDP-N-acetyl-D-glucosamine 2-epimerase
MVIIRSRDKKIQEKRELSKDSHKTFKTHWVIIRNLVADKSNSAFLAKTINKMDKVLRKSEPDLVLILGDRFEALGCAICATLRDIPIGHISGGDVTLGANDDVFRHAISKMSHLHFPTSKESADLLISMGEDRNSVFQVPSSSLDGINSAPHYTKKDLANVFQIRFGVRNWLLTYHPETRAPENNITTATSLLSALNQTMEPDDVLIITAANMDSGGEAINKIFKAAARKDPRFYFIPNFGQEYYYALLRHVDMMIGNSSSGVIEAQYFDLPVVNIGSRQEGRQFKPNVFSSDTSVGAIMNAIKLACLRPKSSSENLLRTDSPSKTISEILAVEMKKEFRTSKSFKKEKDEVIQCP